MKHHLAGTHGNIAPCKKCPDSVRENFLKLLKQKENQKVINEKECFQEQVDEQQRKGATMDAFTTKGKGIKVKQQTINALVKKRNHCSEHL